MSWNVSIHPTAEVRTCPDCESQSAHRSMKAQEFEYGRVPEQVMLMANVPVWTCSECGYQFGDWEADDIRHEAVCRHLGVLPPSEIIALRTKLGLTQKQLADLTKVGEASIKRWEAGNVIQNSSADMLLRIAADAVGRVIMGRIAQEHRVVVVEPRFQTQISEAQRSRASSFKLRLVA